MSLKVLKSLRPESKAIYFSAQIRRLDEDSVRVQMWKGFNTSQYVEPQHTVDHALTTYIQGLPHDSTSFASSGAKYVTCRLTRHGTEVPGYAHPVRIQIAGPSANREWGMEFVLDSKYLDYIATEALAALQTTSPTETTPPMGEAEEEEDA